MPRGGVQRIPRPPGVRPGRPAPWSGLPLDRHHLDLDRVRAALAGAEPPRPSPFERAGARASAVLAPLYEDEAGTRVVLTRRAQHLRSHRGEVSFPGGGQEPDEELAVTALREAHEEVGLEPTRVELIGELDHLATVTSRSFIVPFVGVLDRRPALVANPAEVELILHVPLADLLEDGVFREERWGVPPLDRPVFFFEIEGDTIWGATAAMLRNLLTIVTGVPRD